MKRFILHPLFCYASCLFCLAWIPRSGIAATLIANYAAGSSPTTQGWSISPSTGSVISSTQVIEDGIPALKLFENHTLSGIQNLYYLKALNTPLGNPWDVQMFQQGWEMNITLKVPGLSEGSGSWAQDRNITVGLTRSIPNNREFYSLIFGRDATGATKVSLFGGGGEKIVGSGFNTYTVRYLAGNSYASVYINGEYWINLTPGLLGNAGTSSILWGDNYNATYTSSHSAYYSEVSLYLIPEPSKVVLALVGMILVFLRRRR